MAPTVQNIDGMSGEHRRLQYVMDLVSSYDVTTTLHVHVLTWKGCGEMEDDMDG